jgi:hypothetical protein
MPQYQNGNQVVYQNGIDRGPFTQYLQGYAQQPIPQAQPGISPAAGAASIANTVLAHIRNYRIQDYMMKEQERERQESAYHTAIQAVQNSSLAPQYKQELTGQLIQPFLHTIAGEKPGKSEQAGGHPVVGMLRQYASNLLGGNINNKQVNNFDPNVLQNVVAQLGDQSKSVQYLDQQASAKFHTAYNEIITKNHGALPHIGEILPHLQDYNTTREGLGLRRVNPEEMGVNFLKAGDPGALNAGIAAINGTTTPQTAPPSNQATPAAPSMAPTLPAPGQYGPGEGPAKFFGASTAQQPAQADPTIQAPSLDVATDKNGWPTIAGAK